MAEHLINDILRHEAAHRPFEPFALGNILNQDQHALPLAIVDQRDNGNIGRYDAPGQRRKINIEEGFRFATRAHLIDFENRLGIGCRQKCPQIGTLCNFGADTKHSGRRFVHLDDLAFAIKRDDACRHRPQYAFIIIARLNNLRKQCCIVDCNGGLSGESPHFGNVFR